MWQHNKSTMIVLNMLKRWDSYFQYFHFKVVVTSTSQDVFASCAPDWMNSSFESERRRGHDGLRHAKSLKRKANAITNWVRASPQLKLCSVNIWNILISIKIIIWWWALRKPIHVQFNFIVSEIVYNYTVCEAYEYHAK